MSTTTSAEESRQNLEQRTANSVFTSADAVVPPPSPAWYGSVMGSAILATLSESRTDVLPFAHALAVGFWVIAVVLLVCLSCAFAIRVLRDRTAFSETVASPVSAAAWSMVSMGILSVGSATFAVLPQVGVSRSLAGGIDLALWFVGTAIGIATAVAVVVQLLVREPGSPTMMWGLAVVGPMVSATVGSGLIEWAHGSEAKVWLLMACVACFFLSLVLASMLFGIAYRHHWLIEPLPLAASVSAWLPLGIFGQSTAAAQSIAKAAGHMVTPPVREAVHHIANTYSAVVLLAAIPLALWALAMTVRGFVRRMPFSPGWWAMTFPVGTLVLGSTSFGRSAQVAASVDVGGGLYCFLLVTWTIAAVSSVWAVRQTRR